MDHQQPDLESPELHLINRVMKPAKRLKENANDEKEVNQPELILTDDESSDEDGTELVMKELKEKSKERETNKEKERESEIAEEKTKEIKEVEENRKKDERRLTESVLRSLILHELPKSQHKKNLISAGLLLTEESANNIVNAKQAQNMNWDVKSMSVDACMTILNEKAKTFLAKDFDSVNFGLLLSKIEDLEEKVGRVINHIIPPVSSEYELNSEFFCGHLQRKMKIKNVLIDDDPKLLWLVEEESKPKNCCLMTQNSLIAENILQMRLSATILSSNKHESARVKSVDLPSYILGNHKWFKKIQDAVLSELCMFQYNNLTTLPKSSRRAASLTLIDGDGPYSIFIVQLY